MHPNLLGIVHQIPPKPVFDLIVCEIQLQTCILFKDTQKLIIFELSVPFETNISKIHSRQENQIPAGDISSNGFD